MSKDTDDPGSVIKGFHDDTVENTGSPYLELTDCENQMLGIRVGPVFDGSKMDPIPGLWIEYQANKRQSPLQGPVLVSPETWTYIKKFIDRQMADFSPRNYVISTNDLEGVNGGEG